MLIKEIETRSPIEKIADLLRDPNLNPNIRQVALTKYKQITGKDWGSQKIGDPNSPIEQLKKFIMHPSVNEKQREAALKKLHELLGNTSFVSSDPNQQKIADRLGWLAPFIAIIKYKLGKNGSVVELFLNTEISENFKPKVSQQIKNAYPQHKFMLYSTWYAPGNVEKTIIRFSLPPGIYL